MTAVQPQTSSLEQNTEGAGLSSVTAQFVQTKPNHNNHYLHSRLYSSGNDGGGRFETLGS